jgi:lysophospholipase L1-like esterase
MRALTLADRFFTAICTLQALVLTCCASETLPQNAEANQPAVVQSATVTQTNRTLPILFLVGDSTVHNSGPGLKGWGDVISNHFDLARISVQNHARGGRSSRTFQTQGWWSNVLAIARPGDFVMIQLGHNDGGALNDTNRARGTIGGLGEEATNIVNALTLRPEVVHTYGWYMRKYIVDARDKGMTPVICSPVPRVPKQTVVAGMESPDRYVAWSREVAVSRNADFIDLNGIILSRYIGMTPAEIKTNYFTPQDNTHFSQTGAELNAACVVEGLRRLTNCPLTTYLSGKSRK